MLMNKNRNNIIEENIRQISSIKNKIESLCKILLELYRNGETSSRDIEVLIIIILEKIREMKKYTEEINKILEI